MICLVRAYGAFGVDAIRLERLAAVAGFVNAGTGRKHHAMTTQDLQDIEKLEAFCHIL